MGARVRRPAQRGQILIPALFVIPSLFLFVFLLFETAKLSREKIRHQFAVDSAAFVEMTNYSDFLNRSAYVNGAFPQRIFEEGFKDTMIERKDNTAPDRLYDILHRNCTFPRTEQAQPLDPHPQWLIEYHADCSERNKNPPGFPQILWLLTNADALKYWITYDDANAIYQLYAKIYQLLGSVEDAQFSVFKRLTATHNFFRKSYWLNTGDPVEVGGQGAQGFSLFPFKPKPYCVEGVSFCGNQPTSDVFQPYQILCLSKPVTDWSPPMPGCSPSGLFQVEAIPDSDLKALNTPHDVAGYPGYPIIQHWTAPSNYFSVNFNSLMGGQAVCAGGGGRPCVHATISVRGGNVWPNPTPKFQVKLHP